tara:strand:+ start:426 stop:947 length:522 start_codon:yes stop_codon:yes gene_type:complete
MPDYIPKGTIENPENLSEWDVRINLKNTDYKEYSNCSLLSPDAYQKCVSIYIDYVNYKKFPQMFPLFEEEFKLDIIDRVGYYDKNNKLCAFTLVWRLPSVNSTWASYFAWDYKNPKLGMGNIANKNEIARYKRLGYDYLYLGPYAKYKTKLQGFELVNVRDTYKFKNNQISWH